MRDNTYGSVSTKNHKEDLAERMKKYLFATTCRRRILLKYFAGRNDNDDDNDSFVANINCCDNCTNMLVVVVVFAFRGYTQLQD